MTDTLALRLTRHVPVAPERAWRAWIDPEQLAAWFWPASFDTTVRLDARSGGTYRIASETRGMAVSGDVVTADEPHRLVLTWRWDGDDDETLVTITFTATDDGTDVVVVHERFGDGADRDNHAQGWDDCLDRFADVVRAAADA